MVLQSSNLSYLSVHVGVSSSRLFLVYLSWIFECVAVALAVAVAIVVVVAVVAVAVVTASAANKRWIFKRFYSIAMPLILEIWISKTNHFYRRNKIIMPK